MNKFRLVVWSLNWVVALACGTVGMLWYIARGGLGWLELAEKNPAWGLALFLMASLTVCVNVLYAVLRHVLGKEKRIHIPVKGADPNITVSLHALRNSLVHALRRQPEVASVDVELTHDRKRKLVTHILARGTIWDGPDILQSTMKLQEKVLRDRFHEIVEPEEEPTIEVKLDSFRFIGKQVGFRERVDRIKETYRGPQYPIGG